MYVPSVGPVGQCQAGHILEGAGCGTDRGRQTRLGHWM